MIHPNGVLYTRGLVTAGLGIASIFQSSSYPHTLPFLFKYTVASHLYHFPPTHYLLLLQVYFVGDGFRDTLKFETTRGAWQEQTIHVPEADTSSVSAAARQGVHALCSLAGRKNKKQNTYHQTKRVHIIRYRR